MSPLELGGDLLQDGPGDDTEKTPQERDAQDGWKSLWRRVQAHKDGQALERKAAMKARGVVMDRLAIGYDYFFSGDTMTWCRSIDSRRRLHCFDVGK